MRKILLAIGVALFLPAAAETVVLEPVLDATLIEDPDGARANGSGPYLFAGRNSQPQNSIRRGLVKFDLAGALPPQAIVEDVRLTLYHTGGNDAPRVISLHRVQQAWGEGASTASGGSGAPSAPGDATWLHTFYDTARWVRPGGRWVRRATARAEVGGSGHYVWQAGPQLAADVRLWLAAPRRNHGWLLRGDETTSQNAKRFASRENNDATLRPRLAIRYRLPAAD